MHTLQDVITDIDKEIINREKWLSDLRDRKSRYQKLMDTYPAAHWHRGSLCLDDIWDKVTCMRIESAGYYPIREIVAKFSTGKKASEEMGLKIYTNPYDNKIAEVRYSTINRKQKEILVFNYKDMISDLCPKKKTFLRRIKLSLVHTMVYENLTVLDTSYDKAEFDKMLLLRS